MSADLLPLVLGLLSILTAFYKVIEPMPFVAYRVRLQGDLILNRFTLKQVGSTGEVEYKNGAILIRRGRTTGLQTS